MKLLVCVDMQDDFINGSLGSEHCQKIVPNVVKKVKDHLMSGGCVMFTKDTHEDNYLKTREGKHLQVEHCIKGTLGHQLLPDLLSFPISKEFRKQCFVVEKLNRFGLIGYDLMKNSDHFNELEFIGVATNICVISCAVSFQNLIPNAEITIDASCCASFDPVLHEKALDVMEGLQMNVINRESCNQ